MKNIFLFLVFIPLNIFGQSMTLTYEDRDIPTSLNAYSPTCNGPVDELEFALPAGNPWQVTGVDIEYSMTAQGGGWKSQQRSQIHFQNTNTSEASVYEGTGDAGGIQVYDRNNVSIANGVYPANTTLVFEMRAWRTAQGSGCNVTYNKVNNFTWIMTVYYQAVPEDGRVGIGTDSPDSSAMLELNSFQKGFLPPRMTSVFRDAIANPAEGLIVYCTDCDPAGLYHYDGGSWGRASGHILEDGDGDTYIDVEQYPDANRIVFAAGGQSAMAINDFGHVGIGTAFPQYPLDIIGYGDRVLSILDTVSISGSNFGILVQMIHSGNVSGDRFGSYHSITNSGGGNNYGTRNSILGTGAGLQYGVYSEILNSGSGSHFGNGTSLSGNGSGLHTGTNNTLSGSGTGMQYGTHNFISNTGGNIHEGTRNELSGSGSGIHYGSRNLLSGIGTGEQYGTQNIITNTGNNTHEGTRNELSGNGNGTRYGVRNILSGEGEGTWNGSYNYLSNTGFNDQFGVKNIMFGNADLTGVENNISKEGGTQSAIGVKNYIESFADGECIGVHNFISAFAGSLICGEYTEIYGAGINTIYGSRLIIEEGGTTNYCVYAQSPTSGGTKYAGYFAGDVTVTGTFNNPSDRKFKTHITPVARQSSLSKLNSIQVYQYEYDRVRYPYMSFPEKNQTGVIAQELQDVFPELVKKNIHPAFTPIDENDPREPTPEVEYLGVDYIGLIPHLISAVQELQKSCDKLKEENLQQQAMIEALRKR